jgi:Tol biopolymer transport system component
MCSSSLRAFATATAIAAALVASQPARSAPIQISSGGAFNGLGPSVSDDGRRVAFYSASNPNGANADGSFEIFLYDRPSGTLSQVSQFAGGPSAGGNQAPSLSGDGTRLSYQHFTISGGFGTFQSVLFDSTTQSTTTLTPMAPFGETNELSRDGQTVAIATGNNGLRLFDVAGGTLGPVLAATPFNTALSRDASVMALEFFQRIVVTNRTLGTTVNITGSNAGFNMRPDLSDDGRWLAFSASYDPLGTNADRSDEIFLVDLLNNSVRQVTQTSVGFGSNGMVSLSADGTRLAFISQADLLGTNADGNSEVFLYDVVDDHFTQVTQTTGNNVFSTDPSISGDGRWLAFTSSANLTGANPQGTQQVFLTELAPRVGVVPEPGALGLAGVALGVLAACRRAARHGRRS